MRKLVAIYSLLLVFHFSIIAQEANQNDKNNPGEHRAREEFIGAGREFAVNFAGSTTIHSWDIWVGPAEIYTSKLNGVREIVRVQRFRNFAMLNLTLKELLKPFFKDVFGFLPKVINEKEIKHRGLSGLQLNVSGKKNFALVQILKNVDRVYFLVSEAEKLELGKENGAR